MRHLLFSITTTPLVVGWTVIGMYQSVNPVENKQSGVTLRRD